MNEIIDYDLSVIRDITSRESQVLTALLSDLEYDNGRGLTEDNAYMALAMLEQANKLKAYHIRYESYEKRAKEAGVELPKWQTNRGERFDDRAIQAYERYEREYAKPAVIDFIGNYDLIKYKDSIKKLD